MLTMYLSGVSTCCVSLNQLSLLCEFEPVYLSLYLLCEFEPVYLSAISQQRMSPCTSYLTMYIISAAYLIMCITGLSGYDVLNQCDRAGPCVTVLPRRLYLLRVRAKYDLHIDTGSA